MYYRYIIYRINVTERKELLKRRQFKSDKVGDSQGPRNTTIKSVSLKSPITKCVCFENKA